ncbi:MAG: polysaccharide biosynthesis C-terminal domain-containing protein [Solirubrobacteraceae bacterium]
MSSRRVTGDVAIQIAALVANVAIGVVVTAVLARQLGAVGFGAWSTIFAVVGITGYLSDLKMQEVAIREIAAAPATESAWLGALVTLQVALVVPVAIATAGALLLVSHGAQMRIAAVIVAASGLASVLSVMGVVFRLRVRNDLTMAALTFNSVAWAAAVVTIAAAGGGIVAFALAFTACTVASAILTAVLARRRASLRLRGFRERWRLLARTGFVLGLAGFLSLGHSQIDQLIVYELAPHRVDAGLYGGLNRVLIRAMTLPNALLTTLFPLIAAAVIDDIKRARRLVQSALEYLAMISLPAFGFTLVAAKPILALLYGPGFVSAANTLPVVMGSFVVSCWGYVSANMVIILGLQRRFVAYVSSGLCLNIALNLMIVPRYGYRGAAWITVITESLVIGLSLRAVLRALRMRVKLNRLIRVAAIAAIVTLLLLALRSASDSLLPLGAAAAVAYPALLIASGTLDRTELRALLARRPTG